MDFRYPSIFALRDFDIVTSRAAAIISVPDARRLEAQLQPVDGPGADISAHITAGPPGRLTWAGARLVSDGRLLLINGLQPILRRRRLSATQSACIKHGHAPASAARAGHTERWRGARGKTEREVQGAGRGKINTHP